MAKGRLSTDWGRQRNSEALAGNRASLDYLIQPPTLPDPHVPCPSARKQAEAERPFSTYRDDAAGHERHADEIDEIAEPEHASSGGPAASPPSAWACGSSLGLYDPRTRQWARHGLVFVCRHHRCSRSFLSSCSRLPASVGGTCEGATDDGRSSMDRTSLTGGLAEAMSPTYRPPSKRKAYRRAAWSLMAALLVSLLTGRIWGRWLFGEDAGNNKGLGIVLLFVYGAGLAGVGLLLLAAHYEDAP